MKTNITNINFSRERVKAEVEETLIANQVYETMQRKCRIPSMQDVQQAAEHAFNSAIGLAGVGVDDRGHGAMGNVYATANIQTGELELYLNIENL